ncbi:PREDICTED: uncharacterized protein LOC106104104 isoform X3 [Papilio polytes]|uniref:uncharacterized protein LOC106104104 isoform X3 n=1 Tax=Papilio polytes TaxID=76194 RepID=UPI0006762DAB|nr:PREDICTED: uncharacterized protein LOC106104104 isoform X3 [Papilio polytes]
MVSLVPWSEQHLAFPINYCSLSMACVHDSRPVCATSPDGCSRRKFLDQCDMFEYNCDYNAHYEMIECESPNNSENVKSCTPDVSKLHTTAMKDYYYSIYKVKDTFVTKEDLVVSEAPDNVEILKDLTSEEQIQESTLQESTCKTNCKRPRTWATTVKGETRDFFRILQNSQDKKRI